MMFVSPTKGIMNMEDTFEDIISFIEEDPDCSYNVIVGADSQLREDACFVSAIVLHRLGKGGRYYYCREKEFVGRNLKKRIFMEASKSILLASRLSEVLEARGLGNIHLEIHLDIGENGETRDIIRDVLGMVTGTGFSAKIKPDSFGASKVADKYTK